MALDLPADMPRGMESHTMPDNSVTWQAIAASMTGPSPAEHQAKVQTDSVHSGKDSIQPSGSLSFDNIYQYTTRDFDKAGHGVAEKLDKTSACVLSDKGLKKEP